MSEFSRVDIIHTEHLPKQDKLRLWYHGFWGYRRRWSWRMEDYFVIGLV